MRNHILQTVEWNGTDGGYYPLMAVVAHHLIELFSRNFNQWNVVVTGQMADFFLNFTPQFVLDKYFSISCLAGWFLQGHFTR